MHELSIVCQLIKTLDNIKEEHSLNKIDCVVLQIGEMTDIVPEFITGAWDSAVPDTCYSDTEIKIEIVAAKAKCKECNFESTVKSLGLTCPECGSKDFKIVSGKEFLIKEISAN